MRDFFYDGSKCVTVFNIATANDVLGYDTWYATLLTNVRIVEGKGRNISKTGLSDADSVKVHIMEENLDKPYLDPNEWNNLIDKSEAFTLTQGRDFLVVGNVIDLDVDVPDLFEYCRETYDGVYRITTVDKYTVIPHLEIGGR